MYSISILDDDRDNILKEFGDKYEEAESESEANAIVTSGRELSAVMLSSKLTFSVADLSSSDEQPSEELCSFNGVALFKSGDIKKTIASTRDYIENGNIDGSVNLPDVSLGPFGDDVSRISIVMKDIDDPILMAAMMFSGLDLRAIAGGRKGHLSYALVASRTPIVAVPKVESVIRVRVLQDI